MKQYFFYFLLISFAVLFISAKRETAFPSAAISNGIVHAQFYLPDTAKGYYRGTRFDWSGVISNLEFNNHTYCAQWFDNYNPTTNDAIMGPVESFAPLGYDEAKAGGHFVALGIGTLTKLQDDKYTPFKYYPIVNAGKWKIKTKAASIEFIHTLQDSLCSYEYKKTETLIKGKPILEILHSLKNTGNKTIETSVYNHNLFVFDKQATGAGFTVTFPFNPMPDADGQRNISTGEIVTIKNNQIIFNRALQKRESVYAILKGYSNDAKDYNIKIENHHTGAAVKITCDQSISKLAFWGSSTIFSPEPFIQIKVAPGETFNWTISYEFYNCSIIH